MKMKKITIVLMVLFITVNANAQRVEKLDEYKASNGETYKVGDQVKLGRGSDDNGKFVYVNIGGWAVSTNPEANRLPASNAGLLVTIKKIKKYDGKRYKNVIFTVGGGNITNYMLDIENAIATCEVEKCSEKTNGQTVIQSDNKYDKLKKLKELFDEGVLDAGEYEKEKKKLLDAEE
jgi:hypothetical protein